MKYEVKYDELYDLGQFVEDKDKEITTIYNDIERIVRSISEDKTWDGVDYRTYLNSFNTFIQNERKDELKIENLSILLKNVAKFYKENDEDWGSAMRNTVKNSDLKKEVDKYGNRK